MPASNSKARRFDAASAPMRSSIAEFCEAMGDLTNDGRWRRAAGALRGRRAGGRHPVADDAPLAYARALLAAGAAPSVHRACTLAAKMYAPPHQLTTMRDRLRKKLRTELINSEDSPGERA